MEIKNKIVLGTASLVIGLGACTNGNLEKHGDWGCGPKERWTGGITDEKEKTEQDIHDNGIFGLNLEEGRPINKKMQDGIWEKCITTRKNRQQLQRIPIAKQHQYYINLQEFSEWDKKNITSAPTIYNPRKCQESNLLGFEDGSFAVFGIGTNNDIYNLVTTYDLKNEDDKFL